MPAIVGQLASTNLVKDHQPAQSVGAEAKVENEAFNGLAEARTPNALRVI